MTTQNIPISKTRRDYIQSAIVVLLLIVVSVLSVYFTHPQKLRSNAGISFLGIDFPNFQGIVMRQPRMTVVLLLAFTVLFTAFMFIGREALPFFSRPLAWSAVGISAAGMIVLAFFNHDGTSGGGFRFFVLSTCFFGGVAVLAELMIFYRRFIRNSEFRTNIYHKVAFAIVCMLITMAMGIGYYENAIDGGVILDYGVSAPAPELQIPNTPSDIPDNLRPVQPETPTLPVTPTSVPN